MLKYSLQGLSARSTFFAPYNDINIIVEDEGDENFYTHFFQALLGEAIRITRVTGVGGKQAVIKHYSKNALKSAPKKEFYVVDGDFDDLLGINMPVDQRFFVLPRYDIESFLVEETAICRVAEEQEPRNDVDYYKSSIDFHEWHHAVVEAVVRLVAVCALCQDMGLDDLHVAQNVERFVVASESVPDESEINDYVSAIATQQKAVEPQDFHARLALMLERMGSGCPDIVVKWISGKHVFLPLFCRLVRNETRHQISLESLRFRLVRYCEFHSLSNLRTRLLEVHSNNS